MRSMRAALISFTLSFIIIWKASSRSERATPKTYVKSPPGSKRLFISPDKDFRWVKTRYSF